MKIFKKFDVLIIVFLLIFSFTFFILSDKGIATEMIVELDGKIYAAYDLSVDREFSVNSNFGTNIIVIENKKVYVKESSCKDKLEIKSGAIDKAGQSLVCLPNRLVITLKGDLKTVVNTY